MAVAAVAQEAVALVRAGAGVRAGGVLVAVLLLLVAVVDERHFFRAVVAGEAVGALALVGAVALVAGAAVLAGGGGALVVRVA